MITIVSSILVVVGASITASTTALLGSDKQPVLPLAIEASASPVGWALANQMAPHMPVGRIVVAPLFAQVSSRLREDLKEALLVVMLLGFLVGVVVIITSALRIRNEGSAAGKDGIVAGIIIAAAPAIMYALYHIFRLDGAAISF